MNANVRTSEAYEARTEATRNWIAAHWGGEHFTVARNGLTAKLKWGRKPHDYDGFKCLPWNDVKGRYFRPDGRSA